MKEKKLRSIGITEEEQLMNLSMGAIPKNKGKKIDFLLEQVKSNLTPDLLKPAYRDQNKTNPMYGHCYIATECMYHLMAPTDYFPHWGKDEDGITHWWLEDSSGKIIDATKEQYTLVNKTPPYDKGRRSWFLTNKPSKRTQELMDRLDQ